MKILMRKKQNLSSIYLSLMQVRTVGLMAVSLRKIVSRRKLYQLKK